MTPAHAVLYQQLLAFPIDGPQLVYYPFAQRLADENGWDRHFAERVILEYKRFLFLVATTGQPVSPSDEVDQAWHLHLAYSKSYWQRLCVEVLNKPIHHNPTTGGSEESQKYRQQYEDTLRLYEEAFGNTPPADIWPPVALRFSSLAEGRRIIPSKVWVIPRRPVYLGLQYLALLLLLILPLGCAGDWNPFNLAGMQYFYFYIPILIAAFCWAAYYRKKAGSGMEAGQPLDADQLSWSQVAYLSGEARVSTAALARLVERGQVQIDPKDASQLVSVPGQPAPQHPVEQVLYRGLPFSRTSREAMKWMNQSVAGAMVEEVEALRHAGLVFTPSRAFHVTFVAALPLLFCLLFFGLPRILMGFERGKDTGGILFFTIVVAVGTVISLFQRPRITPQGKALLVELQNRHRTPSKAWRKADQGEHTMNTGLGLAVALFGTSALVGTPIEALKEWYPRPSSDGSSGGCGTSGCSGGGGGCGGGGCGGCGGGD